MNTNYRTFQVALYPTGCLLSASADEDICVVLSGYFDHHGAMAEAVRLNPGYTAFAARIYVERGLV